MGAGPVPVIKEIHQMGLELRMLVRCPTVHAHNFLFPTNSSLCSSRIFTCALQKMRPAEQQPAMKTEVSCQEHEELFPEEHR